MRVVGPVIGICPFSSTDRRSDLLLPVVVYLLDFLHYLERLFVAQIREKLLNMWQLLNRNLIIKLLVVRAVVLIIIRNHFLSTLFIGIAIHFLFLLLVLMELELAAGSARRQIRKGMELLGGGGRECAYTLIVQILVLGARVR